jgi:hypothetical protein
MSGQHSSALDPVPMRVENAGRLTDLVGDECHLRIGNPEDINRDVKNIIRPEFGDYAPWHDIQVLEAMDNAR